MPRREAWITFTRSIATRRTITERGLRSSRRAAAGIAFVAIAGLARGASAHRLDEYLQAARIGIDPGRVQLELDLTPGVAVAGKVIGDIDRDRDGVLSADEKRAYAAQVFGALAMDV